MPGHRACVPHHLGGRALGDDLSPVLARARPHVNEPVGGPHHLLVVLDDEHGVAEVAEPLERADQPAVVALVEPDRRLVEDVQDPDELRPDLRGEPQPLRLAARQRASRAVEVEVADPDVVEEGQALADLLEDPPADQLFRRRQLEGVDEPERGRHRLLRERVDRLLADGHGENLRLEARAEADRARPHRHVLLDPLALLARVGLAVPPLEVRREPLERHRVPARAPHPVLVGDEDPVAARPEQKPVLVVPVELPPRNMEVDLVAVGDRLDHRLVEPLPAERPGHECALLDREARVRDEQVGIDLELRAEPRAPRARAVRRVEGEDPRLELGQRDAVLRAREVLAEEVRLAVDDVDRDEPLREGRRRLDALGEPLPEVRLHHEPVDDHLDRVLELLVERDVLFEQPLLAVDLDAREAVPAQLVERIAELALAIANDGCVDGELRALGERQHLLDDLVEALTGDRPAADRAVRPPDPRIEEAEVVVDLRHRADRRPRVSRRGLLVDRDRRREPVDRVDVRLLHHLEELACVRGERLDVSALPLRVDRVEREARLPGAREAGDADEGIPRERDGDVLEVVLAGAVDDELIGHQGECSLGIGSNRRSLRRGRRASDPVAARTLKRARRRTSVPPRR